MPDTRTTEDIQRRVDEWDRIERVAVRMDGGVTFPLPECPFCEADELWINLSGRLGCYACGGLKR